jgi:PAS domain S-box-containing protein
MPVFERRTLVAVIYLHDAAPRRWLPDEIAFLRDVAERTRSAVQRRHAERRLRELNESLERQVAERTAERNRLWRLSSDLMVVAEPGGVIVAVNPAWRVALGWAEDELTGRSLMGLVHPDDVAATRTAMRRLAERKRTPRLENRYRHRDGGYRQISWAGACDGGLIYAVGRDMSAERSRAAALALSEARMRSVFATSYQHQALLTAEGMVVDANPVSLAAIGATLEAVAGQPFWQTAWIAGTPGLPDTIRAEVARVAAGATFRREIMLELPAGRRVFDFAMRPIHDPHGALAAILAEAIDVTDRRLAEEQLRQAQKVEAIGQLTGGLAHDFNNILTGVIGNLELMERRIERAEYAQLPRLIAAAQAASRRAATLTQRLLAFARRQALMPVSVDANRLIDDMRPLVESTAGGAIALETALAADLWPTRCDPSQLESALLNLAINARDAMPRGGTLTIRTRNVAAGHLAAGAGLPDRDCIAIVVADSGTGMAPDIAARAFDPFYTTKPPGQGTGLGLSMVHGFALQSGGDARIESVPGRGTTVTILLPREPPA